SLAEAGTCAFPCQSGSGNTSLTPPPVAPPLAPAFQTTSLLIALPLTSRCVPPHARTYRDAAGKSTCAWPSLTPSPEPLSPEAQQTVTPSAAASWNAWSNAWSAWAVQADSGAPQLIERTDGVWRWSCIAVVIASRKPRSVFGAK